MEPHLLGLGEEEEEDAGEVVGVRVGEAQLVGERVQEQVAPLCVQIVRQALEDIHRGRVHHRLRALQRLRCLCGEN